MGLLDLFRQKRPSTADKARNRLELLLAVDRVETKKKAIIPELQRDLIEVVKRYFDIDDNQLNVDLQAEGSYSVLEINVELPKGR